MAARALIRGRNGLLRIRRNARSQASALSTSANSQQSDSSKDALAAAVATVLAAGTLCAVAGTREESSCDTRAAFSFPSLTAEAEPRRFMTMQPRNVMLNRMRSGPARTLNDKYNVDWKTILGEGAYGSVHPARLAATGEKVRKENEFEILLVLSWSFPSAWKNRGTANRSVIHNRGCFNVLWYLYIVICSLILNG